MTKFHEIWWIEGNHHKDQNSSPYGHDLHHFLGKFIYLDLFAIYGNFYFIYNFWFKWQNKVPCLFGCLLKTLGFNFVIFSILYFFGGNFSYFLSLSLTQIMGLGVF